MFCVDALYCYNLKAVVVILCEVLPIYGTMDDKLALCIMMIIMNMNNPCGGYPKLRNNLSKVYNLDEIQRLNECTIADGAAEATSEVVTKGKSPVEKGRIQQSDDELTSLSSAVHQQNLLKGLEISKTSKDEVALNNNNVSDESAEFDSNANSCDIDD